MGQHWGSLGLGAVEGKPRGGVGETVPPSGPKSDRQGAVRTSVPLHGCFRVQAGLLLELRDQHAWLVLVLWAVVAKLASQLPTRGQSPHASGSVMCAGPAGGGTHLHR